jgi:Tol biopolymer transport system component
VTLAAGSKLGPYEILAPIGAGGMGEVYRARDPRLGREVAIKVLPASFSQDADRLRRFEQEAKAAGILNHPNITAVYDVGSADGAPYVVQELLEGETLRAELAAGRIPPRRAVTYAIQVAEGLAVAHEKGIVHRDLKPENLFVTREGRVKILDFGLAKLTQPEATRAEETSAPTVTEPGTVMGTVDYMSPEQVTGHAADPRSDIFAVGTVLYEMVSGVRPFRGNSPVERMNAILKEDPPELAQTSRDASPELERLIRHCLEKNPSQRFQSARDLAYDLGAISPTSGRAQTTAGGRRRLLLPALVGMAAAAAIAFLAGRSQASRPSAHPVFKRLTFRRGLITGARFAPDGQTVVYSAAWEGQPSDVYLARPDGGESKPFGIHEGRVLGVSRKDQIAVSIGKDDAPEPVDPAGTLAEVPLLGGLPRSVLDDVSAMDWSPDGKEMAVVRGGGGKYVLEFPAGNTIEESPFSFFQPRVSPDGRKVVYIREGPESDDIVVADRSGGKKVLYTGFLSWPGPVWSPPGDQIWFVAWNSNRTGSSVRSVGLDGSSRGLLTIPDDMGLFDLNADGTALLERRTLRGEVYFRGPDDPRERNLSWLDWGGIAGLTRDGRKMLVRAWGSAGGSKGLLFLRGTDGSPAVRIGEGRGLDLSEDGQWALSLLDEKLRLHSTGIGQARDLPTGKVKIVDAEFFPDGRRILVAGSEPGHEVGLWVFDPADGSLRSLGEGPEDVGAISPDGKVVAALFGKDEQLHLVPVDGGERRIVPGAHTHEEATRWSDDGKWLYVHVAGESQRRHVYRLDPATGRRELWREIVPDDPAGLSAIGEVFVTPDGRSYGYNVSRAIASDLFLVEGLR